MARRNDHAPETLKRLAIDAARALAREEGLRALTVRGVAVRIAYAPGTLYNLFANLDDLIVQMNGVTLRELGAALAPACAGDPASRPFRLVEAYFDFVEREPQLWSILFEHHLPGEAALPDWYQNGLAALVESVAAALEPLMRQWPAEGRRAAVVAMWASLHGISTLAVSQKLSLVDEGGPRRLGHLVVGSVLAAGPATLPAL